MSGRDFELLAASLRADAADHGAFLEALAAKLEGALPEHTHVDRGGLLGGKRVRRVEVQLGESRYAVEARKSVPRTTRSRVVRGIVLKQDELALDEWIDLLSRDLAETAAASERGRQALDRLLLG